MQRLKLIFYTRVGITGKNGEDVAEGQNEIVLNGIVGSSGIVRLREEYDAYVKK